MADTKIERKFSRNVPAPSPHYKAGRSHVEIGFMKLGEQEPYFHVLGGTEGKLRNNRWASDLGRFACCADHDDVRKNWPEYAALVRWHLCAVKAGPMHYEDNALYHAEAARKARAAGDAEAATKALLAFEHTVIYGAVASDPNVSTSVIMLPEADLRAWLRARLPALMAQFRADVEKHFPGMFAAAEVL